MSESGSSGKFSLSGSLDGGVSWQTIIAVVAAAASFIVALINAVAAYYRDKQTQQELYAAERRFEQFKKELEDRQRRLIRFENVQELMKQYKKPLLQASFDLQARIANQVKQNFLHTFIHERKSHRDSTYARYNFAFVLAELLGWLEVIRQEIVFISGQEDSVLLSALVDAIKFQFTGETPVQGVPPKGCEDDPEYDKNSAILQLYAGELRAMGEVMIKDRNEETPFMVSSNNQNLQTIGYAEFLRRMTKEPPVDETDPEVMEEWEKSEKFMQDTLSPLLNHINALSSCKKGEAPTRRLAIIQVLLCRLIDMLDNAVPWDVGRKYDLEAGEEPQYIPRDFRITPLVAYLNKKQKQWLSTQPFMESMDWYVDDPDGEWDDRMAQVDVMYRKLCFCGFREDLATKAQEDREKGADMWPGCFPPRAPRTRPITYYWDNGLDPPAWMIAQAPEARKGFGKLIGWISGEDRSKHGGSEGQPDGLRQRTGKGGKEDGSGEGGGKSVKEGGNSVIVGGRTHSVMPMVARSGPSVMRVASHLGSSAPLLPPPMVVTADLARADTLETRSANIQGAADRAVNAVKQGVELDDPAAGTTHGGPERGSKLKWADMTQGPTPGGGPPLPPALIHTTSPPGATLLSIVASAVGDANNHLHKEGSGVAASTSAVNPSLLQSHEQLSGGHLVNTDQEGQPVHTYVPGMPPAKPNLKPQPPTRASNSGRPGSAGSRNAVAPEPLPAAAGGSHPPSLPPSVGPLGSGGSPRGSPSLPPTSTANGGATGGNSPQAQLSSDLNASGGSTISMQDSAYAAPSLPHTLPPLPQQPLSSIGPPGHLPPIQTGQQSPRQ